MQRPTLLMFLFALPAVLASGQTPSLQTIATMPQGFEPNRGQADHAIDFTSHGPGYTLSLGPDSAWLQLVSPVTPVRGAPAGATTALRVRLVGASPDARAEGMDRQTGRSNYFLGNDSRQWLTDIPRYSRVEYHDVYPGIDVAYYGTNQLLEYDFILGPHADPARIRLAVDGADRVRIDPDGDLVLTVGSSEIRERTPVIYQEAGNLRRPVKGRYMVLEGGEIGFELERYDVSRPLVIDPVFVFSTYFGGTGGDWAQCLALDASGNIYISGQTGTAIPHGNSIGKPAFTGSDSAAFVAKISPAGTLIFATFIAGAADEAFAGAVAVDANENIYLAGNTQSTSFPTLNPLQSAYKGNIDVFALELNPSGNALIYSTYLGGSLLDYATGVAVDASGNTYVSGATESGNFPVWNAQQSKLPGQLNNFAVKIAPGGSSFVYSTYYGGSAVDFSNGMTLDSSGDMVLYGDTSSTNFPVLNAVQPNFCGWTAGQTVTNNHGFVAMLSPNGIPIFSTYICGSAAGDSVRGAAVDSSGNLVITGNTASTTFPTLNPIQAQYGGGTNDAFVIRFSPAGTLLYSTYLGGAGAEEGTRVVLDQLGNIYVTGDTTSANFPIAYSLQSHLGGGDDAFLTKINASGSAIVFSTYLGGSGNDYGYGLQVDSLANAYVAGYTASSNFPTKSALQPTYGGGSSDAFLTVIATCGFSFSTQAAFGIAGGTGSISITTTPECGWTAASNSSWITITSSPASGSGSGTIAYSVAQNTGAMRTGTVTIGGQTVAISQAAAPVLTIVSTHTGSFTQGQNGAAYSLAVSNAASAGSTSGTVTVTETLPSGLTLSTMSGTGWSCSANSCTRSDVLAPGASYPAIAVSVNVAINASSPLGNQVSVSGGGAASATTYTDATTIIFLPVLSLSSAHAGNFMQSQTGSYTLTVSNAASAGPTNGTVTVTETLPAGLTLGTMSGTGWSCSASVCTRSDVLAPASSYPSISVSVTVAANASSPLVNLVSVSGGGAATATATDPTTIVGLSVLSVTSAHAGTFIQTQTGYYTVTVSNAVSAGSTSGTVTVTETLPAGLTLNTMSGTGWSCSANTCTRSDVLAPASSYPSIAVSVTVAANASSPLSNQVSVSGGGSATATASDPTTIVPLPVLAIVSMHTGNFIQSQTGSYTVTVSNSAAAGPTSGTVTVTETLPAGLTLNSMSGTGWSCSANTCTRSDVLTPASSYPSIAVSVAVAANASSPLSNQASVSGGLAATATASDPTTIVPLPVLSIVSMHTGNFIQSQTGSYTVTVSNSAAAGPTSGTVTVTETLPAGLTLSTMSGTGWSCSANTCTRSDVLTPASSYPSIAVSVAVAANASSPLSNQVSVSGGLAATATASDPTTIVPLPVLSVVSAHSGNFTQGQTGSYAVTVSNAAAAGPTSGTVTVTETLPTGLTLSTMSGTGWSCSANTCTRSDVLAPASSYPTIAVSVTVAANAPSPLINQVSVSGGLAATATATDSTTIILLPVLSVVSMHSASFTQGQTGSYAITVSNAAAAGPTSGTVTVTETLPTGLTLSTMSGTGWSCSANTCMRSDVLAPASSYPTIAVSVSVAANAPSSLINQVSVSGGGSATSTATDPTTIILLPLLSITSVHTGNFTQGQNGAVYTVTVSNDPAAGITSGTVTATDVLPSGLTLAAISGSGWNCSANSCVRSDGLMPGASYPAITVSVNVDPAAQSSVTNQVSVSGGGAFTATGSDVTVVQFVSALTLTNQGSAAVSFTGLALTGVNGTGVSQSNDCPASPAVLDVNASCTITVTFIPASQSGGSSGMLTGLRSPPTEVPQVLLSAGGLNFGSRNPGTASELRSVTLTNAGSQALQIARVAISGANAADFAQTNTCGTSVAAGAQCSISVKFQPNAAGNRNASLAVVSSETGSIWSIGLTGSGLASGNVVPGRAPLRK